MKTLVAYYSHGGNNRFLAEKIAQDLRADCVEIRPVLKGMFFVILSSLTKIGFGIHSIKPPVGDYDAVILCGPVYMGQLASPVTDFLNRYSKSIARLFFVPCCGGGEAVKDTKFGYNAVLKKVQLRVNDRYAYGEAFPIDLIVPEELKGNGEAVMKIKLTDETFKGKIVEKYDRFLGKVKEGRPISQT